MFYIRYNFFRLNIKYEKKVQILSNYAILEDYLKLIQKMNMKQKVIIFFMLLGAFPVFSQLKNEQKHIPEGKWVLENVYAAKGCNHDNHKGDAHAHDININDVDIELYTELEVKQNSITLKSLKNTLQGTYVYTTKEGIRFDSPAIPFSQGGNVIAGKLYLQQRVNDPLDESHPTYVSFIYEQGK